ncbi:MAG: hypothetical protein HY925_12140 [Elusimicrobia bacterium]|nr:hypothetical protein [Elusimicrobiota bacterium]
MPALAEPLLPPPTGYARADDVRPPVLAQFSKTLWDGEVSFTVERHERKDGDPTLESFVRQLGAPAGPTRRKAKGKVFALYEEIPIETVLRRLPEQDPYAQSLGAAVPPPRLSFLESRRFHPGGEAYRLYRCRERGAWSRLNAYRDAVELGRGAEFARRLEADGLMPVCFGNGIWNRMQRGEAIEEIPKPSGYRLRIMARDEWATGAVRRPELETVWIHDSPDAIWAVRCRVPERAHKKYRGDFLSFLAGLSLP